MSTIFLIGGVFASFLAALVLVPQVASLAKRMKWIDVPDGKRKQHAKITPRAGGLAIIGATLLGVFYFFIVKEFAGIDFGFELELPSVALLLGGAAIALLGLYDDAFDLGFKTKFLVQVVIAYFMFVSGYRIDVSDFLHINPDLEVAASLSFLLTLLWFVGVMNAINLIDGLDGLASGISLIGFASLTVIFTIGGDVSMLPLFLVIAGAILGFLVFNFNPASIFLGDSGSLFLGFMLATFALEGKTHENSLLALIIAALAIGFPILDTAVAYIRRIVAGKSPFYPDRDHIHHRLTGKLGLTTKRAVLVLYGVNVILGLSAIALYSIDGYTGVIITVSILFIYGFLRQLGYLQFREVRKRIKALSQRPVTGTENGSLLAVEGTRGTRKAKIMERMAALSEEEVVRLVRQMEKRNQIEELLAEES